MKLKNNIVLLSLIGLSLVGCENSTNVDAKFNFTLTYNDNECNVDVSHINGLYTYGTLITISVSENDDYTYQGIYKDNDLVSEDFNYFFVLKEDTNLNIKCEKIIHDYEFTLEVIGDGTINGTSEGIYKEDTEISLSATSNEGSHFEGYYENGNLLSDEEVYVFKISKNTNITAKFALNVPKYAFSITSTEGGFVEGTPNGTYEEGTKISLKANASNGYRFSGYYDTNDTLVSGSASYSFSLNRNTTLVAKFKENGNIEYPEDSDLIYTIIPGQNGVTKTTYDVVPVNEYYVTFDSSLSGEELRTEIRRVTKVKKYYGYTATSDCLSYIDESLITPGKLYGIYNGANLPYQWDGASSWNKEHIWPQSRFEGLSNHSTVKGDMHNLRASTPSVNSNRGNMPYADSGSVYYYPNLNNNVDFRGDVARIIFYMYAQYSNLKLVENPSGGLEMGKLSDLLEWNKLDPVDEFEIQRNMKISQYQGNRNIFIDFPDLVDQLFN